MSPNRSALTHRSTAAVLEDARLALGAAVCRRRWKLAAVAHKLAHLPARGQEHE